MWKGLVRTSVGAAEKRGWRRRDWCEVRRSGRRTSVLEKYAVRTKRAMEAGVEGAVEALEAFFDGGICGRGGQRW